MGKPFATVIVHRKLDRKIVLRAVCVRASGYLIGLLRCAVAANCATAALNALPMKSMIPKRHACPHGELTKRVFAATRPLKRYSSTRAIRNAPRFNANRGT